MSQAKTAYEAFDATGHLHFPEGVRVVATTNSYENGRVHTAHFVFPDGSELACSGPLTCHSVSWGNAGETPYTLQNQDESTCSPSPAPLT